MAAVAWSDEKEVLPADREGRVRLYCIVGGQTGTVGQAPRYQAPVDRRRQRRRYFWRRASVLLVAGALGAVAWSAGERLLAGASVAGASVAGASVAGPGLPRACPAGQMAVPAAAGTAGGAGACGVSYVARPGDTIWSVAVQFDPRGDPRSLEDELEAQIGGGSLQPGQVLVVPR